MPLNFNHDSHCQFCVVVTVLVTSVAPVSTGIGGGSTIPLGRCNEYWWWFWPLLVKKLQVLHAKLLICKEWQEIWNCCDGNKLHAINPTVGVTKQNDSRSRRDAVILNRLQIGHTRVTHAHLLGDDEAFCATCYTSLTVKCEPHSYRMSTV